MSISVPIIIRNAVKLNYPLDRVVHSVVGLADEVVILVDPTSEDDTLDYVYDLSLDVNSKTSEHGTTLEWFASAWDLANIKSDGNEFAVQTNLSIEHCTGDWILCLQADEAIHEENFEDIRILVEDAAELGIDAWAMPRLYFFGDLQTIREDWTVEIVRLFRKGTRVSTGDAMNTSGSNRVSTCWVPIYHYSRIGDPSLISKRILSLDRMFHSSDKLMSEHELPNYDFSTNNFDCMHKGSVDVGKVGVEAQFSNFVGTHPVPFRNYTGYSHKE